MRKVAFLILPAGGVIVIDSLAKILAQFFLDTKSVQLVPGVVLRVFENIRGPFGLGPLWIALAASVVVIVVLLWRLRFPVSSFQSPVTAASLGLLLGGGLSNLGERLLFGRTTDLLVLWNLTALNVADVAILCGFILLVLRSSPLRRGFSGKVQ